MTWSNSPEEIMDIVEDNIEVDAIIAAKPVHLITDVLAASMERDYGMEDAIEMIYINQQSIIIIFIYFNNCKN